MIETECFKELNIYYQNGLIVPDLRLDSGLSSIHNAKNKSKTCFLMKLFR